MKERNVKLEPVCRYCHKTVTLMVNADDLYAWRTGKSIQNAMPYLNPGERELLLSGFCNECFDKLFGEVD